jgi:hypothetical protein
VADQVTSWLTIHDPALYTGPRGIHTPKARDALSALAVAQGEVPAPSNAQVTGSKKDALLQIDQKAVAALKAANGNVQDPNFQNIWTTNLAGAAVTLSELARNSAGYQPQTLNDDSANSAAYQQYLRNIGSCPLFILQMSDRLTYDRETSDWNTVISAIADTFQGIAASDQNAIVKGLTSLAQAASSKMKTTQTENVFVQNAVNLDNVVTLYLYNSQISFYEESGKGYDTKQTKYDITRCQLTFQSAMWPDYAAAVAAKQTSSVNNWLNNNSTSTAGTKPIPALQH